MNMTEYRQWKFKVRDVTGGQVLKIPKGAICIRTLIFQKSGKVEHLVTWLEPCDEEGT